MSMQSSSAMVSQVAAYIAMIPPGIGMVVFNYNPEQITMQKQSKWHSTPQATQSTGTPQYHGAGPESVTITMVLDTFSIPPNPPDVAIAILKQALVANPVNVAAQDPKPATVMFGWGTNIVMEQAYIKSMSVTYKRFLLGTPVKADVSLTLEEVPLSLPGTNPTSGALASRRTHTVVEGDTLASIAFHEYREASKWRALAEANGIDDPMRVRAGTQLLVPDHREAGAVS